MSKKQLYNLLTKNVKGISDPKVFEYIQTLDWNTMSKEITKPKFTEKTKDIYYKWIVSSKLNSIRNLNIFPNQYFTSACTDSLNAFLFHHKNKRFRTFFGEYPYIKHQCQNLGLNFFYLDLDSKNEKFSTIDKNDAVIISCPFSATGTNHKNTEKLLSICSDLNIPVMVDMAYWGTCRNIDIDLNWSCIESVCFSLSKAFNLGNIRFGIEFSKRTNHIHRKINDINYYNKLGAFYALKILKKFNSDYVQRKYRKSYSESCQLLDLNETDVILFALSNNKYKEFHRDSVVNRPCITQVVERQILTDSD